MDYIVIKKVETKKDIKKFMQFGNELYKNEPNYVPPLLFDEINSVNPKKNLAYEYCETVMFLAYIDKKIVGRIRGLINHKYNEKHNIKHLRFNHLDMIDDVNVTKKLIDAVVEWGKAKGMTELNGPIGYVDVDKQGMLIDGFDQDGMFITYYNFPYYVTHFEQLGFIKDVDWVEYKVNIPTEVNPKIERIALHVLEREKLNLVKIKKMKDLPQYLYKIFDIYNKAFAPLHGVVELSKGQVDALVSQFKSVLNLEYLSVVTDQEDNVVAFALLVPSLNEALKKNKGRLFPFGFIPLLKCLKHSEVLDMYFVAVTPERQNQGINSILMWDITKTAIKNNIKFAETGPELEDNTKVRSFWKHYDSELIRKRRCWIKKID